MSKSAHASDKPGRHQPGRGAEVRLVPIGPVPRAMLGACRPGAALEPVDERDGWALYHLSDPNSPASFVAVAIRTPEHPGFDEGDARAGAFLRRARTNPRAYGELQALLTFLSELDGLEGQWLWGDAARAVYGPAAKSCQIDHIRVAAALLAHGCWPALGGTDASSPWGGAPVLRLDGPEGCATDNDRRCRCRRTVRLEPSFAKALVQVRQRVPVEHLRLPQDDHPNPEGRVLSRPDLLRIRAAALHLCRPVGDAQPGAMTFKEVLSTAGVDVSSQVGRRHLGDVFADVVSAIRSTAARVGVELRLVPVRARRLLDTVLDMTLPARPAPRRVPSPRPVASAPRPPAATAARPDGQRAPPPRQ